MDKRAKNIPPSRSDQAARPSFLELAAQQRVTPVQDFERLLGKPSDEDESAEKFSARLRDWRREGGIGSRR